MSLLTAFGGGAPIQPLDNKGSIVPGGLLTFKTAGLNVLQNTYADAQGMVLNPNPVVLDGNGRALIFLLTTPAYDITFTDASSNLIWFAASIIANAPAS